MSGRQALTTPPWSAPRWTCPSPVSRFCGAEGLENVTVGSIFRNREFLDDYGVEMVDGHLSGLTARAVVVIAPDGTVAPHRDGGCHRLRTRLRRRPGRLFLTTARRHRRTRRSGVGSSAEDLADPLAYGVARQVPDCFGFL